MPETKKPGRGAVTTALDVAGALLICAGVACIYWPAGIVLAGVACIAASWAASR